MNFVIYIVDQTLSVSKEYKPWLHEPNHNGRSGQKQSRIQYCQVAGFIRKNRKKSLSELKDVEEISV